MHSFLDIASSGAEAKVRAGKGKLGAGRTGQAFAFKSSHSSLRIQVFESGLRIRAPR
jgi:hypothetical protein